MKLDNNNTFLDSIDFANISENKFKYCIGVFPVISNSDISLKLKSVYRILSTGGKFIFLFHSAEGLQDIKYLFDKILSLKVEESFLPCFDIISLGNFTNSLGYKNVVVDKSKYIITTKNINEFFKFIRDIGESNYLLNRNKQSINKTKYARLQKYFEKKLAKNRMIDNQISISFLTGKKES